MYSLFDHGAMIADQVRMDAYLRAMKRVITPKSCVLDIGTGSGIFALMAARLGARKVFAIEPDDIIGLARRLIEDNGFSDRITLIQADAREVTLDEPADVIVSDLGGHLPWHGPHLQVINRAQDCFLARGGVMIPAADRVFAAVVSCDTVEDRAVWRQKTLGLDLSAAAEPGACEFRAQAFEPEDLLSEPVPVVTLDYRQPLEINLDQKIALDVVRKGTACGVALWFDREVSDSINIQNAPEKLAPQGGRRIYSPLLFSWPEDVDVVSGDSVRVSLKATYSGEDYEWRWDSLARKISGGNIEGVRFSQSAGPVTVNGDDTATGKLSAEGKALRLCLSLMADGASNEDVADALMREFPKRYPRRDAALAHVAALCREFA